MTAAPDACCAQPAADFIRAKLPPGFVPKLGIVLGSGIGDLANEIQDPVAISYADLPGFPVSSVSGHAGKLVLGGLNGVSVACLQGRVHLYEGMDPAKVRVYIYTLRLIGCETLFLTSAVGSLVPENGPGTLVCLSDHINLQGRNPLIGPNDAIGPRFPSMLDAYDPSLRTLLGESAKACGVRLPEGVYLAVTGPSFETPAEIRAFRTLGADVVGMSMVPEVICARHCGLRVAAVSVCVNLASGMSQEHITHDDTLLWASRASADIKGLLREFMGRAPWGGEKGADGKKRKAGEALQ